MSELLRARLAAGLDQRSRAALSELELPQPRTEGWRYSALRPLERALGRAAEAVEPAVELALGATPGQSGWPTWQALDPGSESAPKAVDQAFAWLARSSGGELMELRGEHDTPLRIEALAGLGAERANRHRRLRLAPDTRLTVIEHWRGAGLPLANLLTEVELGEGAQLHWLRLVEGSSALHGIARSEFRLAAGASLQHYTLELGAAWSRHDLQIRLTGAGAVARSYGLLPVTGKRHADTQLAITHAHGDTQSESRWRAVAAGRSRAVFNGRIQIDAGADGSDAMLHIGSLLLSERAEIDAKPELEIHADAVKAAHGAAIGQLDPQALFYLRSRGLPQAQARQILMRAWSLQAVEGLAEPLLDAVQARLDTALAALTEGAGA